MSSSSALLTRLLPPAEVRALTKLALPVVVAQLGLMTFGVVDTMMVGHYSSDALSAVGAGHILSMLILLFGYGLLQGLDPLIAQAVGAGRLDRVAAHFRRGLVLTVILTVLTTVVMWQGEFFLRLFGQQAEIIPAAGRYLGIVAWGNFAFLFTGVLRQTLQSHSIVKPMVWATLWANLFNIIGNWALVYGKLGCPELGLVGSAWSTAASRWLLIILLAALSHQHWRHWIAVPPGTTRRGYGSLLYLGLPLAIQISLEAGIFNAVGFLMGAIGTLELAANQVTLNMVALVFMVPMGISAAAATRVGNAIGANRPDDARAAARVAFALGTLFMLVAGVTFLVIPEVFVALYTPDPATVELASSLLMIGGCFAVFDGTQAIAHGVLRGSADTRFPALVSLVGYWGVGLPIGYFLTFRGADVWSPGLWWGLTFGLATVAIILVMRSIKRFSGDLRAFDHD